jgi:hypothetical protein
MLFIGNAACRDFFLYPEPHEVKSHVYGVVMQAEIGLQWQPPNCWSWLNMK